MNDIIKAVYLVHLKYAMEEDAIRIGKLEIKKMAEFSKILAVDEVLKNKLVKMEEVYGLQLEVGDFLDNWANK